MKLIIVNPSGFVVFGFVPIIFFLVICAIEYLILHVKEYREKDHAIVFVSGKY